MENIRSYYILVILFKNVYNDRVGYTNFDLLLYLYKKQQPFLLA